MLVVGSVLVVVEVEVEMVVVVVVVVEVVVGGMVVEVHISGTGSQRFSPAATQKHCVHGLSVGIDSLGQ